MLIVLILGLALLGAALVLVARAVGLSRLRAGETLGQINAYGYSIQLKSGPKPAHSPLHTGIDSLAGRLGAFVTDHFGAGHEAKVRGMLIAAGIYNLPARRFIGYRVLAAVGTPLLLFWVTSQHGVSATTLLATIFGAVAGWILPMTILRRRMDRRLAAVERALPDLIDILVVTIEAGLGFAGSMQLASSRISGPLGQELRLTMQEQTMGLSSDEALRNLVGRVDTPSMRSFVRSILQGEALGVSIGQILRDLSREMRLRRRQYAEERAQKAPVKILFPLIFLIFPAMFVILLGPAVFSFMDAFGGGG
jgi:tight adherence protein C